MTPSLSDLISRASALPDLVYRCDVGRAPGGAVEAWLLADGESGSIVLRVHVGQSVGDYGPHDVVPSGMPADELVLAWIDPVARAELARHGFWVGGFANVSAAGIALAKRFLSQPPLRPPVQTAPNVGALVAATIEPDRKSHHGDTEDRP